MDKCEGCKNFIHVEEGERPAYVYNYDSLTRTISVKSNTDECFMCLLKTVSTFPVVLRRNNAKAR